MIVLQGSTLTWLLRSRSRSGAHCGDGGCTWGRGCTSWCDWETRWSLVDSPLDRLRHGRSDWPWYIVQHVCEFPVSDLRLRSSCDLSHVLAPIMYLRAPWLLARVDAKLLQIMPKLQILLDKGKVTFNNNIKQKRFRLLNFPRAAILDFMTSLRCLYCWKAEVLLFETIGQRSDVMKSKMPTCGKFKTRNLFCLLLLLYFSLV